MRPLVESIAEIASPDFVSIETSGIMPFSLLMIICVRNLKAKTGVYGLTAFDNLSLGKMSDPNERELIKKEKDK